MPTSRRAKCSTWKGVHIFHFFLSSCSQKLRIFLNLKGIDWQPHPIDLSKNENLTEWFLGINPRGLLPVLVHDGAVHIESNDIITYLDAAFPKVKLIPEGHENQVAALLKHEDDLHMDLRGLSFRFVFAPPGPPKSAEDLETLRPYRLRHRARQERPRRDRRADRRSGRLTPNTATPTKPRANRRRPSAAPSTNSTASLPAGRICLGDKLTVLDIAWFIYVNRLVLGGYPLERLHPRLAAWFADLMARPEFAKEVALPPPVAQAFAATRKAQRRSRQVAGGGGGVLGLAARRQGDLMRLATT